jgi:YHS domain-containing protein
MFRNLFLPALLLALGMLLPGITGAVQAEEGGKDDAAAIAKQTESYPLKTCVVTGEGLDSMGKPYDMLHEGRLVRFCCKGCVKKFKADPEKYLKLIDEAAAKAKAGAGEAKAEGK